MEVIFKYSWILLIAVTVLNAVTQRVRFQTHIANDPSLKKGYEQFFYGSLIYWNIPWVIVGIGNLSGLTSSVFDYFSPKSMNPMVLTFYGSIIVLWVFSLFWVFAFGGADFIEKHPGLFKQKSFFGSSDITAKKVKLFLPLMVLGGIAGLTIIWYMDMPLRSF